MSHRAPSVWRWFAALVLSAMMLQACALRGRGIVPSEGLAQNPLSGQSDARRLTTLANSSGRSPDGAYQIRTLHDGRISIRNTLSYATPLGTFTQIEYATPYGYLALVQSPKRPLPSLEPSPSSTLLVIANGATVHGASWVIVADPKPNFVDVHVDFSDSSIDTTLPASISINVIEAAIGELY